MRGSPQVVRRRVKLMHWACYYLAVGIIGYSGTISIIAAQESNGDTQGATISPPVATNPAASPNELSLDSLLDLADKSPEGLQSVGVKDVARELDASPDSIFSPDENTSKAANSTGGLLSQAPGVIVRSTGALNQDVRLRGYSGSQLVGVANGMNQVKTRLDIDSLFSQIDPLLVEEVTVTPGPYSVEFGPGFAFFDARLLTPQRADKRSYNSRSNFGYNSNGRQLMWREALSYADVDSGAIVNLGQRMGNDYQPGGDSRDFNVPASYHVQDIYMALSKDISKIHRIDVNLLHQSLQNTELPGVAYDINQQNADQVNLHWTIRDDASGVDRVRTQFWWNEAAFNADGLRPAKMMTFNNRLLGESYTDMANGGFISSNGLTDNWGARSQILWGDNEIWQARTGTDWRRVRQVYRESDLTANRSPALGNDVFGIPDSATDDFGLFASGDIKVTEQFTIGAGQRLDRTLYQMNSNDIVATTTASTPTGTYMPGFNANGRTTTLTYLNSTYHLPDSDWLTFNSGVAYASRPPNLTERYSDQPFAPLVRFGNSFAFGNSTLQPEKDLQFDFGMTAKQDGQSFGARVFHSTITDYIGLAPNNYTWFPVAGTAPPGTLNRGRPFMADPNSPPGDLSIDSASIGYSYRNISRVTLAGFELMGEQQVRPWLEFVEIMSYTRGTNDSPTWIDAYTGQVNQLPGNEGLPGIYPLYAILTARLVEPEHRKWTLEWQSRYAAQQNHLANSLGEIGTPGFGVHNINASYRWSEYISWQSSLLNVFDRNYYEHNSLAIIDRDGIIGFVKNPGISWFTSIDWRF